MNIRGVKMNIDKIFVTVDTQSNEVIELGNKSKCIGELVYCYGWSYQVSEEYNDHDGEYIQALRVFESKGVVSYFDYLEEYYSEEENEAVLLENYYEFNKKFFESARYRILPLNGYIRSVLEQFVDLETLEKIKNLEYKASIA